MKRWIIAGLVALALGPMTAMAQTTSSGNGGANDNGYRANRGSYSRYRANRPRAGYGMGIGIPYGYGFRTAYGYPGYGGYEGNGIAGYVGS